ncbi:Fe2+-dependent dioxygenase [Wenzhouxiangella sediminis]|uniref:Fe2+-dependent dioxygenase n=1 Tax=Wenzhouxiangella sediminis TaxID=1792836 RepID=A0A3E1KD57_9GAMM|nr:Fe2+-dependent dioxygenase [Wenzhouxiangella sediminis]RFF32858.1 Fe2+-dependent dioxygenase [Wenzhouxiangella sediminis]
MLLQIADCLEASDLEAVVETAARADFTSGENTAGRVARTVKHNLQAEDSAEIRGLLELVERRLRANPLVQSVARPMAFVKLLLSRYEPGMAYGSHVDNALMKGQRTDLSFTLLLSDPASYEGGELVMEDSSGERAWKPAAGSLLLYPSTTLHRVEEVTRGERLAVVGWIQSRVRSAEQRELLFDLERAMSSEYDARGKTNQYDRLSKCFNNLLRRWLD